MLDELLDVISGATVLLLPLLLLAMPCLLLATVPLALAAIPLVIAGAIMAIPFLLFRSVRRRQ
jgi:hypothetical protein